MLYQYKHLWDEKNVSIKKKSLYLEASTHYREYDQIYTVLRVESVVI